MKNLIFPCTVIMTLFSFNSWAQNNAVTLNDKRSGGSQSNTLVINDKNFNPNMKVKYYHVEETTQMKFGGYKTIYDVTNPKLIRTYDLGPNNTRVVTPVFEEAEEFEKTVLKSDTIIKFGTPAKITISDAPKKADSFAYIDIIKTYQRVSDKGFESVEMLKKMANSYFFSDEFEKAEKYYGKLFAKTTDLEPEYYYRYSISLKSLGKLEKANEYLKKFNQLSSNNTR